VPRDGEEDDESERLPVFDIAVGGGATTGASVALMPLRVPRAAPPAAVAPTTGGGGTTLAASEPPVAVVEVFE